MRAEVVDHGAPEGVDAGADERFSGAQRSFMKLGDPVVADLGDAVARGVSKLPESHGADRRRFARSQGSEAEKVNIEPGITVEYQK